MRWPADSGIMEASSDDIDKGWAWVVAFATTLWNMLFCGILRSFGLLYLEMQHVFHARPGVAGWVPGAYSISVTILAPVSGYLSDRYSVRTMVLVAGLLGSIGLLTTAFAPNIYVAIVGYGVLTGSSGGMADGPILAHLSRFFRKRRAVANGIAFAGSSIGTLVLPLVFAFLIQEYTVRGTFLVTAGLWLHVCIVGMVLRPISSSGNKNAIEDDALSQSAFDVESPHIKPKAACVKSVQKCNINLSTSADIHQPMSPCQSLMSLTQSLRLDKRGRDNRTHVGSTGSVHQRQSDTLTSSFHAQTDSEETASLQPSSPLVQRTNPQPDSSKDSKEVVALPMSNRTLATLARYDSEIIRYSSTPSLEESRGHQTDFADSRLQSSAERTAAETEDQETQKPIRSTRVQSCVRSTACQLLTNLKFLRLAFFLFCGFFGYLNNLFLLPPYAEDIGIDLLGASAIVSIAGFSDLASRLLFGFVGDLPYVRTRRPLVANLAFFICGSAGILVPSFPDYISTCVYAVVIGLFGGIFVVYMSSMVAETIGEENLGTGMGVSAMALGTASSVGPPVFGTL